MAQKCPIKIVGDGPSGLKRRSYENVYKKINMNLAQFKMRKNQWV